MTKNKMKGPVASPPLLHEAQAAFRIGNFLRARQLARLFISSNEQPSKEALFEAEQILAQTAIAPKAYLMGAGVFLLLIMVTILSIRVH